MTSESLAAWIRGLERPGIAVAAGPIEPCGPFDAGEAAYVANAVASRREEFHTGRKLARAALSQLGCAASGIPVGAGREPRWPTGFTGSISHCRGECVVVAGRRRDYLAIGIDFERKAELAAGVVAHVCRDEELGAGGGIDPLLRFVAKEAFYKAYFPVTNVFLEFHDVRVDFELQQRRFTATLVADDKLGIRGQRGFAGEFAVLPDHFAAWLSIHETAHPR